MKKLISLLLLLLLIVIAIVFVTTAQTCQQLFDAKNYKEAFPVCQKAAEQGDALEQMYLGVIYRDGAGVEPDDEKAAYWYEKAAEQGDAFAQMNLGGIYYKGIGVKQDDEKATYWYQKAAKQGEAFAQYRLGGHYKYGRGIAQDSRKAAYWYQKAAEQGNTLAQAYLALLYYQGAKDKYHPIELGTLYDTGEGFEQDYKQAYAWFWVASQGRSGIELIAVSYLEAKLTPEELVEAKALGEKYYKDYGSKK